MDELYGGPEALAVGTDFKCTLVPRSKWGWWLERRLSDSDYFTNSKHRFAVVFLITKWPEVTPTSTASILFPHRQIIREQRIQPLTRPSTPSGPPPLPSE